LIHDLRACKRLIFDSLKNQANYLCAISGLQSFLPPLQSLEISCGLEFSE
jgi:hypothetical protein